MSTHLQAMHPVSTNGCIMAQPNSRRPNNEVFCSIFASELLWTVPRKKTQTKINKLVYERSVGLHLTDAYITSNYKLQANIHTLGINYKRKQAFCIMYIFFMCVQETLKIRLCKSVGTCLLRQLDRSTVFRRIPQ
jgi:hypothetical protein